MTFYLIYSGQWRACAPYEEYEIALVGDQYRTLCSRRVIGGGTSMEVAVEAARTHCIEMLTYFGGP